MDCKLYSMLYVSSKPASDAAQAAKQLYATRIHEREEVGSLVFNSFVFMQVHTQDLCGMAVYLQYGIA